MSNNITRHYKWFQLRPVTIPSDGLGGDIVLTQMVEPKWNGKCINPVEGFVSIEDAETALIWKYDPENYGDYFFANLLLNHDYL